MIKLIGIKKSFGRQTVLDGIDLEFAPGQITAVVGPSGTGKSVMLKLITGLIVPDQGEVFINDKLVNSPAGVAPALSESLRSLGFLFQNAGLLDSLTALENVVFPLVEYTNLSYKERIDKGYQALIEVGMEGYANHLPGEISIGMRKRVGIARALVLDPKIIVFDEPNTGLDPETGQEIYDLIKGLQAKGGFTGIVVSHEIPEVFQISKRIVMLYNGKVVTNATVEEFKNSTNPFVMQFSRGSVEGPIRIV